MRTEPIYLDNHATTRPDPRVVEAMLPWLSEEYGNPASRHALGDRAREAVEQARATIAGAIHAEPGEVLFTSGATESNNLALCGVTDRKRRRGDHLVSVATEHRAVLDPLKRLAKRGFQLDLLGVAQRGSSHAGRLDPDSVRMAIRDSTCLVSVMTANNEVGVVQPIPEIGRLCRQAGVVLHTDATQAVGKLPIDVRAWGVGLMSFTAHKLHGPRGVGALFVSGREPSVRLEPQMVGGGQERGLRSGTLNTAGIVGFAKAIELCQADMLSEEQRLRGLRARLYELLMAELPDSELCGPALDATDSQGNALRLAGNLDLLFPGIDGETLLMQTPEIAASSGAACSSADPEPSHVLQALGYTPDEARCTVRFGLGRFSTQRQMVEAAALLISAVRKLRRV